jgi:hypothetical protein
MLISLSSASPGSWTKGIFAMYHSYAEAASHVSHQMFQSELQGKGCRGQRSISGPGPDTYVCIDSLGVYIVVFILRPRLMYRRVPFPTAVDPLFHPLKTMYLHTIRESLSYFMRRSRIVDRAGNISHLAGLMFSRIGCIPVSLNPCHGKKRVSRKNLDLDDPPATGRNP